MDPGDIPHNTPRCGYTHQTVGRVGSRVFRCPERNPAAKRFSGWRTWASVGFCMYACTMQFGRPAAGRFHAPPNSRIATRLYSNQTPPPPSAFAPSPSCIVLGLFNDPAAQPITNSIKRPFRKRLETKFGRRPRPKLREHKYTAVHAGAVVRGKATEAKRRRSGRPAPAHDGAMRYS
jgi:hypothetical protein